MRKFVGVAVGALVAHVACSTGGVRPTASGAAPGDDARLNDGGTPADAVFEYVPKDVSDGASTKGRLKGFATRPLRGSTPQQRLVSLCELVRAFDGPAGIFVVEDLVGVAEDIAGDGRFSAFTYITLRLEESWKAMTPDRVVARISGGPTREPGVTLLWQISLSVGERVGLLLSTPADNQDFHGIQNLGLFADRGGGATNGQIFTRTNRTLAEVGMAVDLALQSLNAECVDTYPDYGQAAP